MSRPILLRVLGTARSLFYSILCEHAVLRTYIILFYANTLSVAHLYYPILCEHVECCAPMLFYSMLSYAHELKAVLLFYCMHMRKRTTFLNTVSICPPISYSYVFCPQLELEYSITTAAFLNFWNTAANVRSNQSIAPRTTTTLRYNIDIIAPRVTCASKLGPGPLFVFLFLAVTSYRKCFSRRDFSKLITIPGTVGPYST